MRIKSVRIKNFRCLNDVQVDFDDVTTFLGPNGAGKSSILRALDWFFNSNPDRLTEEDVYSGASDNDRSVWVEVTFAGLTGRDREELGDKYAPTGAVSFNARRTWDGKTDKMTGKALAFPPFDAVRAASAAADKKAAYEAARTDHGADELPKWTRVGEAESAMTAWESQHRDLLQETELETPHLFGFNGRNKLSGLFDFVLVTADLRASEESVEGRKTVIGRILERAINRDAANDQFAELAHEVSVRQAKINEEHLSSQLDDLATQLTKEVGAFTTGREVRLNAVSPEVRPSAVTISLAITDAMVETTVDRQGHGFQRALLISSLKLLASRGSQGSDESVIALAIEEPELFQHPSQARVFARVLRDLASESGGLQVTYATHSPYFVDPKFFDQVRRVSRKQVDDQSHPKVTVHHATLEAVAARVDGFVAKDSVLGRWDQVCTKNLAEALFADAVVLVEGSTDKGVLDGIVSRSGERQFEADGITVALAGGKQHLFIPHAILTKLDIPTLTVFDSDCGQGPRMRTAGKTAEADKRDESNRRDNRAILRYFGAPEEDFPVGLISPNLFAWDDDLERVVQRDWPDWETGREAILTQGRGSDGKNAATYALAAKEAGSDPTGEIREVINAARSLVQ